MTSRTLKLFAASGGTAALAVVGMLVLGSSLAARSQSEDAGFHKSLEGAWHVQLTVRNCQTGEAQRTFPALFTFAKGGTLTATTAGQPPALSTPLLGIWRHMGGHTYSAVSETFIFNPAGAWIQTHRLTRTIEVDNNADEFTETVNLEIFGTTGNLIATGCATSVATRLEMSGE